jgi:predicted GTPase
MKKKNELMDVSKIDFNAVIKTRLAEKYADDAIVLIEETKRLKKAYERFQGWVDALEKGDFTVIEKYKKIRKNYEDIDEYEED